jgi:hypothetical protein
MIAQQEGFTVLDVARRYRVGPDRVRQWIKTGQLAAVNTRSRSKRCRYVVTLEALLLFEKAHAAATPTPIRRKKRKKRGEVDFFPD